MAFQSVYDTACWSNHVKNFGTCYNSCVILTSVLCRCLTSCIMCNMKAELSSVLCDSENSGLHLNISFDMQTGHSFHLKRFAGNSLDIHLLKNIRKMPDMDKRGGNGLAWRSWNTSWGVTDTANLLQRRRFHARGLASLCKNGMKTKQKKTRSRVISDIFEPSNYLDLNRIWNYGVWNSFRLACSTTPKTLPLSRMFETNHFMYWRETYPRLC